MLNRCAPPRFGLNLSLPEKTISFVSPSISIDISNRCYVELIANQSPELQKPELKRPQTFPEEKLCKYVCLFARVEFQNTTVDLDEVTKHQNATQIGWMTNNWDDTSFWSFVLLFLISLEKYYHYAPPKMKTNEFLFWFSRAVLYKPLILWL